MQAILVALIAYLVGGINAAYIIGRLRGFDIRERGSGNAGASNAVITMGKKAGALSALFDIFKAFLVVKLAILLFSGFAYAGEVAGVACILGHIFPAWMKFRGGKGLACMGGAILAYDPVVFLIMLTGEFIFLMIVNYVCAVPISASIIFPFVYYYMTGKVAGVWILLVATVVILFKHIENLKRIRNGTEIHFSYLWKKEEETERVKNNAKQQ